MKKLILMLLLLPLAGMAQTTFWQDSLARYQKRIATVAFGFPSMTATQKSVVVNTEKTIWVMAQREIISNQINDSIAFTQARATARANLITALQGKGYACDNSQDDYNKLYNHPAIFGANWQARATYERNQSISNGLLLDHFLNCVRQIWQELNK